MVSLMKYMKFPLPCPGAGSVRVQIDTTRTARENDRKLHRARTRARPNAPARDNIQTEDGSVTLAACTITRINAVRRIRVYFFCSGTLERDRPWGSASGVLMEPRAQLRVYKPNVFIRNFQTTDCFRAKGLSKEKKCSVLKGLVHLSVLLVEMVLKKYIVFYQELTSSLGKRFTQLKLFDVCFRFLFYVECISEINKENLMKWILLQVKMFYF